GSAGGVEGEASAAHIEAERPVALPESVEPRSTSRRTRTGHAYRRRLPDRRGRVLGGPRLSRLGSGPARFPVSPIAAASWPTLFAGCCTAHYVATHPRGCIAASCRP